MCLLLEKNRFRFSPLSEYLCKHPRKEEFPKKVFLSMLLTLEYLP